MFYLKPSLFYCLKSITLKIIDYNIILKTFFYSQISI